MKKCDCCKADGELFEKYRHNFCGRCDASFSAVMDAIGYALGRAYEDNKNSDMPLRFSDSHHIYIVKHRLWPKLSKEDKYTAEHVYDIYNIMVKV